MGNLNDRTILRSFSIPASLDDRLSAAAFQQQVSRSDLLMLYLRTGLDIWEKRRDGWAENERFIEEILRGEEVSNGKRWNIDAKRLEKVRALMRAYLVSQPIDEGSSIAVHALERS